MKDHRQPVQLVQPQQALEAIANATVDQPIILDFDETLLLRNSTAEYINSLRPRFIGFALIMLLKVIRPWRWLPGSFRGDKTRDWFLVTVPTILLPWTLLFWRSKAQKLAEEHRNTQILAAIQGNQKAPVIVASLGFNFIVEPILKHLPMRCDRLVGCRFWRGAGDRNQGKLLMMQDILTESEIKSAILVTDSQDDLPLLQVVEQPCLVLWSLAKYVTPFNDFWLYDWGQKFKRLKSKQSA
ncbi:MAG: haloacid dehalogenase-like hydrolase [Cyanobacteria bacterium J06631_6]